MCRPSAPFVNCLIALTYILAHRNRPQSTRAKSSATKGECVTDRHGGLHSLIGAVSDWQQLFLAESDRAGNRKEDQRTPGQSNSVYREPHVDLPASRLSASEGAFDVLDHLSRSELLVTARELASILSISLKRIYSYAERNMIRTSRLRRMFASGRDFAEWLCRHASITRGSTAHRLR